MQELKLSLADHLSKVGERAEPNYTITATDLASHLPAPAMGTMQIPTPI